MRPIAILTVHEREVIEQGGPLRRSSPNRRCDVQPNRLCQRLCLTGLADSRKRGKRQSDRDLPTTLSRNRKHQMNVQDFADEIEIRGSNIRARLTHDVLPTVMDHLHVEF